jgi:hypothetical protein
VTRKWTTEDQKAYERIEARFRRAAQEQRAAEEALVKRTRKDRGESNAQWLEEFHKRFGGDSRDAR